MKESNHRDRAFSRRTAIMLLVAGCGVVPMLEANEQQKNVRDLCWGKDETGKEVYIPCGEPRAIAEPTWLVLNLDDLRGFKVTKKGQTIDIGSDEIWAGLGGA
jgi:hypothetical protein